MKTLWTAFPFFGGLVGHDPKALRHLMYFYRNPRKCDPSAKLLLTGDLTSSAKKSQFDRCVDYIVGLLPPPLDDLGLNTGPWLKEAMGDEHADSHQAIPGNHDHWPGRWRWFWLLGGPGAILQQWQPRFPFVGPPIPLSGTDVRLRFLSLNSDAAVWPWGPERILARGNFQNQLRELASALSPVVGDPNEIRVLLLHHSLVYEAKDDDRYQAKSYLGKRWYALTSRLGQLEMNHASRRDLRTLLARCDIPVVLTGHTHSPLVRKYHTLSLERRRPVGYLEARCGTTTQVNEVPSKWPSVVRNRRLDENTLLVHQLYEVEGPKIVWQTHTLQRDPERGFERVAKRGEPWDSEIVVWPR
jgi:hypothetical protein